MSDNPTWTCADCTFKSKDTERAEEHELENGHTTHPVR